MRLLLGLILLLFVVNVFAAEDEHAGWFDKDREQVVVRAFYTDDGMLHALSGEKDLWKVDKKKGYAVVQVNQFEAVELLSRGYRLELDQRYTEELNRIPVFVGNAKSIPGFACYRTVSETYADAEQLAADNPDLAQWVDIGDSWEKTNGLGGHDLRVLKITNSAIAGAKPALFVMSAIHAREYVTAETNMRFAEHLLNNYNSDADARWLVDNHEIHLSLISNPDGRVKAQTGISWRKNTNQNYCSPTSNNRGADLNRNFEFQWGCCGGSSSSQCSETYRGPSAGSEPEVDAIQTYVRNLFPDQRGPGVNDAAPDNAQGVFIDIHSFSELVIWPWGYTFNNAPNADGLQTLGRKMAWFNDYTPEQATGLGITDGATDDFAYGELGVAAYTFELGTTFFQDCASFESTIFPDNLDALVYAAKTVRAPYLLSKGPDVIDVSFASNVVAPGDIVSFTGTASDTRYNNSNGAEPVQPIASVDAFVDLPPWAPAAVPIALAPSDGAFNSSVEDFNESLDTTGLSAGEHIVYFQARDADGNDGVVTAQLLYVIDSAIAPVISGTVTAADTGQGLEAVVSAGGFQTTSDAGTGAYQLLVLEGDYTLTVTPADAGYAGTEVSGINASNGQTTTQDFDLFPFCSAFSDDAETAGAGWTSTGNWARTQETANSPVWSWTDSPGSNYGNNQNVSLTSPVINLAGSSGASLEFAQICDTEATYDFCIVEISSDGSNWTEVARYDQTSGAGWNNRTLDISAVAGSSAAQLRFRLNTDFSVTENGWHVDDIVINAAGPQCITATDTDGDGAFDDTDNCTLVANPAQLDADADGFGNACDADLDNNCIVNFLDLGQFSNVIFQTGTLPEDFNGDGVVNFLDLPVLVDSIFQTPGPSALASCSN